MLRLLVVVRLLALLAVATYTLLTILRWYLLKEPSKGNAWAEAGGHEIKLYHICTAACSEAIPSPTHLTQQSYTCTLQSVQDLRSSCLSRRSKPECSAQLLFSGRASKKNAVLLNIMIPQFSALKYQSIYFKCVLSTGTLLRQIRGIILVCWPKSRIVENTFQLEQQRTDFVKCFPENPQVFTTYVFKPLHKKLTFVSFTLSQLPPSPHIHLF